MSSVACMQARTFLNKLTDGLCEAMITNNRNKAGAKVVNRVTPQFILKCKNLFQSRASSC